VGLILDTPIPKLERRGILTLGNQGGFIGIRGYKIKKKRSGEYDTGNTKERKRETQDGGSSDSKTGNRDRADKRTQGRLIRNRAGNHQTAGGKVQDKKGCQRVFT